jgi:hypothetical protein
LYVAARLHRLPEIYGCADVGVALSVKGRHG